jgi:hypothetical protein
MKKSLHTAIAFILFAICAIAQPPARPPRERVEAMKVGFITERLNLSVEEAREFWPVYNKMQDEVEALRKNRRINLRDSMETMSDAEVDKMVDSELAFRQNELDIIKKYHPQFKKILPVRKVALLYRAEEDFKRRLLDILQERRQQKKQGRRGGPMGN